MVGYSFLTLYMLSISVKQFHNLKIASAHLTHVSGTATDVATKVVALEKLGH